MVTRNLTNAPTVFDLFDRVFGFEAEPRTSEQADKARWILPVDIYERDGALVIRAAVPGVRKGDLSVTVNEGVLTIEAESKLTEEADQSRYFRREVRVGRWSRSLRLPDDIDTEAIAASLEEGVLKLSLPRVPESKPRVIEVNIG